MNPFPTLYSKRWAKGTLRKNADFVHCATNSNADSTLCTASES